MSIQIAMNNGESFGSLLTTRLREAGSFYIATAYLNRNGLTHILEPVKRILDQEGEVNVIHGFYPLITETEAIRELTSIEMDYELMEYGVFRDNDNSNEGNFHPKIYLTKSNQQKWHAVIGSSNLTRGGLISNVEVNCSLTGTETDHEIRQCKNIFQKIKANPNVCLPNAEWIDAYDRIRRLERENQSDFHNKEERQEAYDMLERAFQVPSWEPKTRTDCVIKALQNLALRDGESKFFHLSDITQEAEKLAKGKYETKHFDAGVRQALNTNTVYREGRQLFERDGGEHARNGRYRLHQLHLSYRGAR